MERAADLARRVLAWSWDPLREVDSGDKRDATHNVNTSTYGGHHFNGLVPAANLHK